MGLFIEHDCAGCLFPVTWHSKLQTERPRPGRRVPEECPQGIQDLWRACTACDPGERPSADDVQAAVSRALSAPAPKRGPAAMAAAARADSASVLCDALGPKERGPVGGKASSLEEADTLQVLEASPFACTPYHPLQDGERQAAVGALGLLSKQAHGARAGERPAAAGTACENQQPAGLHAARAAGPDLQRADRGCTPACGAAGPKGLASEAAPEPAAAAGASCPAPQPEKPSRGGAGCSDPGSADSAGASGPQRTQQGGTSAACCEDGRAERARAPARQPAERGSGQHLLSAEEAHSGAEWHDSGDSLSGRPLISNRQNGQLSCEQRE